MDLSAADLEQVAQEAGIDPAFVRRAIVESQVSSPETERSPVFGEVKTLEIVELMEGEVSPDSVDRMLEEVQRAFADGGRSPVPAGLPRGAPPGPWPAAACRAW